MTGAQEKEFEVSLLGRAEIRWMEERRGIVFSGRVPEDLELFQDHFPAFPVLPGVLALEILKKGAEFYGRRFFGARENGPALKAIRNVKFSAFLKPGDAWDGVLEIGGVNQDGMVWKGRLTHAGQTAVSAQLVFRK